MPRDRRFTTSHVQTQVRPGAASAGLVGAGSEPSPSNVAGFYAVPTRSPAGSVGGEFNLGLGSLGMSAASLPGSQPGSVMWRSASGSDFGSGDILPVPLPTAPAHAHAHVPGASAFPFLHAGLAPAGTSDGLASAATAGQSGGATTGAGREPSPPAASPMVLSSDGLLLMPHPDPAAPHMGAAVPSHLSHSGQHVMASSGSGSAAASAAGSRGSSSLPPSPQQAQAQLQGGQALQPSPDSVGNALAASGGAMMHGMQQSSGTAAAVADPVGSAHYHQHGLPTSGSSASLAGLSAASAPSSVLPPATGGSLSYWGGGGFAGGAPTASSGSSSASDRHSSADADADGASRRLSRAPSGASIAGGFGVPRASSGHSDSNSHVNAMATSSSGTALAAAGGGAGSDGASAAGVPSAPTISPDEAVRALLQLQSAVLALGRGLGVALPGQGPAVAADGAAGAAGALAAAAAAAAALGQTFPAGFLGAVTVPTAAVEPQAASVGLSLGRERSGTASSGFGSALPSGGAALVPTVALPGSAASQGVVAAGDGSGALASDSSSNLQMTAMLAEMQTLRAQANAAAAAAELARAETEQVRATAAVAAAAAVAAEQARHTAAAVVAADAAADAAAAARGDLANEGADTL